jgi:predicted nucleic acid-binding protein
VIVLDSSFLVAYHNRRDVHHEVAAEAMRRLVTGEWGRALLLEYVFLEVVTVLLARRGLSSASEAATTLLEAHEVEFVPCSELFLASLETFRRQPRALLSFTDAAIVTVARTRGDGRIATFDADFGELDGIAVVPA